MNSTRCLLALLFVSVLGIIEAGAQISFTERIIDKDAHGDIKAISDLDHDGIKDLILAEATLAWYKSEDGKYVQHKIADPQVEFTTDGYTGDVDNDGDVWWNDAIVR